MEMKRLLFAWGLLAGIAWCTVLAGAQAASQAMSSHASGAKAATAGKNYRHHAGAMPESAKTFYSLTWGVDQLSAQLAESGQLVRFSYRVVDAGKAAVLHDKASTANLVDEKARVALQVPVMEKVGPLRQAGPPENGKSYWMAFSNKGNVVRSGHRVSVLVGQFRVDGLLVQ